MEGLLSYTAFTDLVCSSMGEAFFTLFDVGCSGGIDPAWRRFGARLKAFGFDPNRHECERLRAAEDLAGVAYVNAFVGPGPDHPFIRRRSNPAVPSRSVWHRLSGALTMETRARQAAAMDADEKRRLNMWQASDLTDTSNRVSLCEFAGREGVDDVDFIKIDVDGEDFAILNEIGAELARWRVLGVGLEVNFDGSEGDTEHSFHNTDRFMRARGFDLFSLTIRRYSLAALPGIFVVDLPAETMTGRPQLGDAIYLRDLPDPRNQALARSLKPSKLLKLAAIASLCDNPDVAADILLTFGDRLGGLLNVPHGLDLLAAQVQSDTDEKLGYMDFIAAYEADSPILYRHGRPPKAAPGSAVGEEDRAALRQDAERTIAALRAELDAIRGSASWRLTSPMRRLERHFAKRHRGARRDV